MFASAGVGGRSFSRSSLRGDVANRFALYSSVLGKPAGLLRAEDDTGSMRRVQCGREKKLSPPLEVLSVLSGGIGWVCRAGGGTGLGFAMEPEVSARREGGCLFPKPSTPTMSATLYRSRWLNGRRRQAQRTQGNRISRGETASGENVKAA